MRFNELEKSRYTAVNPYKQNMVKKGGLLKIPIPQGPGAQRHCLFGQVILCWRLSCSSIPHHFPLDASSTFVPSFKSQKGLLIIAKCPQGWRTGGGGGRTRRRDYLVENHSNRHWKRKRGPQIKSIMA